MKPIMHLYSDKVTITDKRELMPLMKGSTVHVAASKESGIIYTNVSEEDLNDFIAENMKIQSNLMLLKLAVNIAPEVKTVPNLRIADDDTVFVEETSISDLLMINKAERLLIVGIEGKIYTNNVKLAKEYVQKDADNGEFGACLLQSVISMSGLIECDLQVEK